MMTSISRSNLCVIAMLAVLSMNSYGQDSHISVMQSERGGRPGAAMDKAAASVPGAGHRHGNARADGMEMHGGGTIWLSDAPPARGGSGSGNARGGGMGGGYGARALRRLWARAGTDPQKSGFARADAQASTEILLVTPLSTPEGEPLAAPAESHAGLAFEMPAQGYYRVYLTTRRLQGETLNVSVAKAEVANFAHGGDEEEQARGMQATRMLESAPIEIVRERQPNEKMFFQLKSGDEQPFLVLQKGLPLPGARVRFVSHQGWSKEAVSDARGRVSFQVIRDYFPLWGEFQKRFKATYLVIAEANAAESGSFRDQPYNSVRYQTTLSGSYQPSPTDYLSYAWGLGIGLLIVLFSGVAVYLYRRRRVKPFPEVRFDETK